MILFPAVDLKNGQCVRLEQGDMARATVFNLDPAAQAASFAAQGFVTEVAQDVTEALARVRTGPDLVVLDRGLPDGDGLEVLREMSEEPPRRLEAPVRSLVHAACLPGSKRRTLGEGTWPGNRKLEVAREALNLPILVAHRIEPAPAYRFLRAGHLGGPRVDRATAGASLLKSPLSGGAQRLRTFGAELGQVERHEGDPVGRKVRAMC